MMPQNVFFSLSLCWLFCRFYFLCIFQLCFKYAALFLFQRCLSLYVCPSKLQVEVEVYVCEKHALCNLLYSDMCN